MTWTRNARANAFDTKSFIAVLDANGEMIDADEDADEAYLRAERASPTGTVAVDDSVLAVDQGPHDNPPGALKRAASIALDASFVDVVRFHWASFDPRSPEGRVLVRDARAALRDRGNAIYQVILEEAKDLVHAPRRRLEKGHQGGMAGAFDPAWLTGDLLRQNQKMGKVLGGGDALFDSIGLSLLPHGASFRDPLSLSTDQGPKGVTFCKYSTAECRKVCLVNTGQRSLESGAFAAGYLFSALLREMPLEFMINLFERCVLEFASARERGFRRFIRLNVLSDLPWELIAPGFLEAVCEHARAQAELGRHWMTSGLAFYDYTKTPYRRGIKGYYDLTFSFSGARGMSDALFDVLEGKSDSAPRTAVVFVKREERAIKKTGAMYRAAPGRPLSSDKSWHAWDFLGERVWNGDLSDVRPLDPRDARVIGLTYKPARYKVAPTQRGKKFGLVPVVAATELDRQLPTFLVRVRQPDPDAPPIVVGTQDPDNRKLELPRWQD